MNLTCGNHLRQHTVWAKSYKYLNYLFSIDGTVLSLPRNNTTGGLLKLVVKRDGYIQCSLSNGVGVLRPRVHAIIAELFIPNIDNKPQVNHKDYDKANNRLENLEWSTPLDNTRHSLVNRTPLGNSMALRTTLRIVHTTLSKEQVMAILALKEVMSFSGISKKLNIGYTRVQTVCKGETIRLIPYIHGIPYYEYKLELWKPLGVSYGTK